jgi:hypothetical protein
MNYFDRFDSLGFALSDQPHFGAFERPRWAIRCLQSGLAMPAKDQSPPKKTSNPSTRTPPFLRSLRSRDCGTATPRPMLFALIQFDSLGFTLSTSPCLPLPPSAVPTQYEPESHKKWFDLV